MSKSLKLFLSKFRTFYISFFGSVNHDVWLISIVLKNDSTILYWLKKTIWPHSVVNNFKKLKNCFESRNRYIFCNTRFPLGLADIDYIYLYILCLYDTSFNLNRKNWTEKSQLGELSPLISHHLVIRTRRVQSTSPLIFAHRFWRRNIILR